MMLLLLASPSPSSSTTISSCSSSSSSSILPSGPFISLVSCLNLRNQGKDRGRSGRTIYRALPPEKFDIAERPRYYHSRYILESIRYKVCNIDKKRVHFIYRALGLFPCSAHAVDTISRLVAAKFFSTLELLRIKV